MATRRKETAASRSRQMSRIKSKNTGPEKVLRSSLWQRGLRYRIHAKTPAGRPDVVFPGSRVAVFIDGCYWHGCPEHYVRPRSRLEFWDGKLQENVDRDLRQTEALKEAGWLVLRFWEHEVFTSLQDVTDQVEQAVRKGKAQDRIGWRVHTVVSLDETGDLEHRTLVSLADPTQRKQENHKRHTRKWKRPPQKPEKT